MDRGELFRACIGRTKREDVVRRADILEIVQAEIDQKIRLAGQKVTVSLTLDGLRLVPPDDYLDVIGIFDGHGDRIIQFDSDYDRPIYEYRDGAFLFSYGLYSGTTVTFQYYRKLERLVNDNSTNELLTRYPTVYIRGIVREVHLDDEDYDAARAQTELFRGAIDDANSDTIKSELDLEHVEDYNSQQYQV